MCDSQVSGFAFLRLTRFQNGLKMSESFDIDQLQVSAAKIFSCGTNQLEIQEITQGNRSTTVLQDVQFVALKAYVVIKFFWEGPRTKMKKSSEYF